MINKELTKCLKALHLPAVRECYQEIANVAVNDSLSYEQFLLTLMERELHSRYENRKRRYLKNSKLPLEKTLSTFNRKRLPEKVNNLVTALLSGQFIENCENILAFGNPGSGKTHLLCAIGNELIHQGKQILFSPCNLLVQNLLIAKRDLKLSRYLKKLSKYDAIIIDDIGYVQQSR